MVPARPVPFAFVAATLIVQKPASGNVVVYVATWAELPEPVGDNRTWDAGTVIDPDPPLGSRYEILYDVIGEADVGTNHETATSVEFDNVACTPVTAAGGSV